MTVHIDTYGHIVPQALSVYKVILSGAYEWSHTSQAWLHGVENTEPKLPLSGLLSEKLILDGVPDFFG